MHRTFLPLKTLTAVYPVFIFFTLKYSSKQTLRQRHKHKGRAESGFVLGENDRIKVSDDVVSSVRWDERVNVIFAYACFSKLHSRHSNLSPLKGLGLPAGSKVYYTLLQGESLERGPEYSVITLSRMKRYERNNVQWDRKSVV